ncbi:MAG: response regulator [Burkholderiaceae bacterium]|jgi:putative two-component system response regulator|nr:response regulator [Burkholderiales bacterium]MCZ8337802.1 response regulator [Burkholderiaceae bacterium]
MDVVIVDDNPVNLTVMEHLVSRVDGASPRVFRHSEEGLSWCSEHDPDLVIVDYQMPDIDGMKFIERMRALPGRDELPLLMVTANTDRELRRAALEAGATDFLHKPVDRAEFTARVRNMLRLRAMTRRLTDRAIELEHAVTKATRALVSTERDTLLCLARAAEYRDPETGAHVLRMAEFSRALAGAMGKDADYQALIRKAAPLHDVGKLGTPDHILLKPARLTPQEMEVMKQHTTIGWQILREHRSPVLQMGAAIAWTHHEKWDGSGYPRGLTGTDIPLEGRIVAVADVLDALTSARPYKHAWDVSEARAFIEKGSGVHFDPQCVEALGGLWDEVRAIRDEYHD